MRICCLRTFHPTEVPWKQVLYPYLCAMKKIFHLSTCNTNQKILKEWKPGKDYTLQNIKEKNISSAELDYAARVLGSYEALFSRRALKYKSMGLAEKDLTEKDYRKLILSEYTFLKRPVMINGKDVFAGSAKAAVDGAKKSMRTVNG